jgi:hypothetical protein
VSHQCHALVNVVDENHAEGYLMSEECRVGNHKVELIEAGGTDFMPAESDVSSRN